MYIELCVSICDYQTALQHELQSVALLCDALLCSDVYCDNGEHIAILAIYADQICKACLESAKASIPVTSAVGEAGRIPGWNEHVAPLKSQYIFWHNLWRDYGMPRHGIVADIMRKTRSRYHAAIRQIRKQQDVLSIPA